VLTYQRRRTAGEGGREGGSGKPRSRKILKGEKGVAGEVRGQLPDREKKNHHELKIERTKSTGEKLIDSQYGRKGGNKSSAQVRKKSENKQDKKHQM